MSGTPGEQAGDPQHHRRRINPGDLRTEPGRMTGGGTRPASDVGHCLTRGQSAELPGQAGPALPAQRHDGRREEPDGSGEAGKMGVVIGDAGLVSRHAPDLDS
jgi:hypothetical protein